MPRIGAGFGGLPGPAIRPIALRLVYQAAQAVKIPLVGMGGIASGTDAAEFLIAGACAVEVGTATFWVRARRCESPASCRNSWVPGSCPTYRIWSTRYECKPQSYCELARFT